VTARLASFQLLTAWSASATVASREAEAGGRGGRVEPLAMTASAISLRVVLFVAAAFQPASSSAGMLTSHAKDSEGDCST
jgi:hypothetical protein